MQEQLKWYIDAARSAGREVIEQGSLNPETQEILDRPLSEPEIYSQMANAYWDSVVVTEPKAEPAATAEETGTPLAPPRSSCPHGYGARRRKTRLCRSASSDRAAWVMET